MEELKTINLEPYHCESHPNSEGFTLELWGDTPGGKRVKVRLAFKFWWIRFLAKEIWKSIKYRENEVAEAKNSLTIAQ